MRTVTANELAVLLDANAYKCLVKVEVLNSASAWIDLANLQGFNWLHDVMVDCERIDQPVSTATVTVRREAPHGLSAAPLMSESPVNIVSAVYSPLFDVGVPIRISVATIAATQHESAAVYRAIFQGRIDRVGWAGDPITLSCSDDGAWLMDTQIESEETYGSGAGVDLEDVIQAILDDWPSILGTVTLQVPSSPGWALHAYKQDRVKVFEAIRALAQQIGWEVAFSYDASHNFELTLFESDRAKTTPDQTIGPTQYHDIRTVNLELDNIRNVVTVPYYDTAGTLQIQVASDTPSISKLGRRYMEIQEASTSNIDSSTEAAALAAAVVSDLVQPPITHEVEMPLFWPAQFGDLYRFLANGVHYDDYQDLAVVGVRHHWRDGIGLTTLSCAGKVRGAYRDWLRREVNRAAIQRPYLTAEVAMSPTQATITFKGGPFVKGSLNNGAFAAATSPVVVNRSASGGSTQSYVLKAFAVEGRSDEQTIPFTIPPRGVDEGVTVPGLDSVSATTTQAPDCGVEWRVTVGWNTDATNNTEYFVRIRDQGGNILFDDQTTADSSALHLTGVVGDPAFTTNHHEFTYTVQIVRRSDNEVIDSMVTSEVSVDVSDPC